MNPIDYLQSINKDFKQCFEKSTAFEQALKTSDVDKEVFVLITRTIPKRLESYLNDNKFIADGSVGKGLATKTPWIAIMDKEITNSTREGVYLVFLFSSDYKHVYLTLNQGTTVPGQFGPRLGKKEVSNNSKKIRDLLNIDNSRLKTDGNADIADERYRLGAIYYTLWNPDDDEQCQDILGLYLDIYKKYKRLTMNKDSSNKTAKMPNDSRQRIFYGAPGTGKSHAVKELTRGKNVIRTTFHPDSDYASFVGCYKPTTKQVPVFSTYGEKAVAVKGADGQPVTEDRIVYEFVEQAFLQAYINAWKLYAKAGKDKQPEEQYLIIEEINRGNCAQIFGDLFQLLDRDDAGFSEYPIKTDSDMQKRLEKAFADMAFLNAPALCDMNSEETAIKIRKGEILVLPDNLCIWATMNTSDQSLFPIDSAFKRRWEWQYVPIFDAKENWKIEVDGNLYDWWSFLEEINKRIGATTNSEDKKLGYFFCKAENGIISAEKFVNKVIFYLWNDVFKDFGFDDAIFKDEDDSSQLTFNKFYDVKNEETIVKKDKVERFLKNLGLIPLKTEDNEGGQTIPKDPNISDDGEWFKSESVIFKITEYPKDPNELYERARGSWWMAADRAEGIKYFYAYASPVQKIVACYKVTSHSAEPDNNGKIRYKFEGDIVSDDPMIGKSVETIAHAKGGVVFYPDNINK